jgi:hypothetical protein
MKKLTAILICAVLLTACAPVSREPQPPEPERETPGPTELQEPAATAAPSYADYEASKDKAVSYLINRLNDGANEVYVYRDFGASVNCFTQKAKIHDGHEDYVADMNENFQEDPYSGDSAIECRVKTAGGSWGGWMFLNGYLEKGATVPGLSFGERDGVGLDLMGSTKLTFWAKGASGGETAEFFTAGLGYDGEHGYKIAEYPDSTAKRSTGFITLTNDWARYEIDLSDADMSYISCGFGFVCSGTGSGNGETVFYLDDIRFEGDIASQKGAPRLIKSYETDTRRNADEKYIANAAFSYDNALAAMAFISEDMREEAEALLDAFCYSIDNDRFRPIVRNAYAYGDIRPFPGWESGARLPGWYDTESSAYFEDRYQVGTNTGNSSYVALALLQYYCRYGNEKYLDHAKSIMDWVELNCSRNRGFIAGFDGNSEGGGSAPSLLSYKSIEHNIDAYAAFKILYTVTGEDRYKNAYENALSFIDYTYNEDKGYFYIGTIGDGVTLNKDIVVLDAQVWSALALRDGFKPYEKALDRAISMHTAEGGFPFYEENEGGGYWPEGTAFTALALRLFGHDAEAMGALCAMQAAQLESGGFPAATVPALNTGIYLFNGEPWTYGQIPHIAPAAWYVMAVNGFDPYTVP